MSPFRTSPANKCRPADARDRARRHARLRSLRPSLESLEQRLQMTVPSVTVGALTFQGSFTDSGGVYSSDGTVSSSIGYTDSSATFTRLIEVDGGAKSLNFSSDGSNATYLNFDSATLKVATGSSSVVPFWGGTDRVQISDLIGSAGLGLDSGAKGIAVESATFVPTEVTLNVPATSGLAATPTTSFGGSFSFVELLDEVGQEFGFGLDAGTSLVVDPTSGFSTDVTITVEPSEVFHLDGLGITPRTLSLSYNAPSSWSFSGGLKIDAPGEEGTTDDDFSFSGTLGYDGYQGFTIDGGKVTEFSVALSLGITLPGAVGQKVGDGGDGDGAGDSSFSLGLIWDQKSDTYKVYGSASYASSADDSSGAKSSVDFPTFALDFGDPPPPPVGAEPAPGDAPDAPGLTITDGTVTELDASVTTSFSIGPVDFETDNLGFLYVKAGLNGSADPTLAIYGEVGASVGDIIKDAKASFGTDSSDPGLIVNLRTGRVDLEKIDVSIASVNAGAFSINDIEFSYDATKDEIKAGATLILPAGWGVGVYLTFIDDKLDAITGIWLAADEDPGIEIGDTGLALNSVTLTVGNLDHPEDLSVSGDLTFVYGDVLTVGGNDGISPFVAVGSFYVDRHQLDLDGSFYAMAYTTGMTTDSFGNPIRSWQSIIGDSASASIDINWSQGIYSLSVTDWPIDEIFTVSGSLTFDKHGDIVLSAECDLVVPKDVPFIGGKHLAGIDFLFAYDAATESGFVAAWTEIHFIKTFEAGFEYAFDSGSRGRFSLIGAKSIGQLQQQAATYISGRNSSLSSYEDDIAIDADSGADGFSVEVAFPNSSGTQSVTIALSQGTPFPVTVGAAAVAGPGGTLIQAFSTGPGLIQIDVGIDPNSGATTLPGGEYEVVLLSTEDFDQSDVTFTSILRYLPPTIRNLAPLGAGGPIVASTLQVTFSGTVARGLVKPLGGTVHVNVFVDADSDGIERDGLKVDSFDATLNDDGSWSMDRMLDFNGLLFQADVRVYSTVDDTTNPVTFADVLTNIEADPTFSGNVFNYTTSGTELSTGVPGLTVFIDLNHDGTLDYYAPTVPPGQIPVLTLEPTAVTGVLGAFTFEAANYPGIIVDQGVYDVVLILPSEKFSVQPGSSLKASYQYSASGGESIPFKVIAPTTVSGTVWDDPYKTMQTGSGAPGQTVYIDLNNNAVPDAGEPTTTTSASGQYGFYGIDNGIPTTYPQPYIIRLLVPAHAVQTGPAGVFYTANIQFFQDQEVGNDFFVQRFATLTGTVTGTSESGPFIAVATPQAGWAVAVTAPLANYPSFPIPSGAAVPAGLSLVGSSSSDGTELVISEPGNTSGTAGAAWLTTPYVLDGGFDVTFQFQGQGAGFAFVVQPISNTALGDGFGALGYGSVSGTAIANSLAVEFDMFRNAAPINDPDGNHVAVHINGDEIEGDGQGNVDANALSILTSGPLDFILGDAGQHTARIFYLNGQLQIYLNGSQTPALSVAVDLPTVLGGAATPAYLGFTSASIAAGDFVVLNNFEARRVLQSTTSDVNGNYTFTDIPPDVSYEVVQRIPEGWRQIAPVATAASYQSTSFNLNGAATVSSYQSTPATLDYDGDGQVDVAIATIDDPTKIGLTYLFPDLKGGVVGATHLFLQSDLAAYGFANITAVRIATGYFLPTEPETLPVQSIAFLVTGADTNNNAFTRVIFTDSGFDVVYAWAPSGIEPNVGDVVVGDFNNDGLDDLLLTMTMTLTGGGFNNIYLVTNVPGLQSYPNLSTGNPVGNSIGSSIAAADVDGDGNLDYLILTVDGGGGTPLILYGTGQGTISGGEELPSLAVPSGSSGVVALGDVDGDGRPDVVVMAIDSVGDGTINYLLQTSSRNFPVPDPGPTADTLVLAGMGSANASTPRLDIRDINGDGLADLVTPTHGGRVITTALNRGLPFLANAEVADHYVPGASVADDFLGSGDFNGDGLPDFFAIDSLQGTGPDDHVVMLLSTGADTAAIQVKPGGAQTVDLPDFISTQFDPFLGAPAGVGAGYLSGLVYEDRDGDGARRGGEAGVGGVLVYLDEDDDGKLDSHERVTGTNAQGVYRFAGLTAGTKFPIRLVLPTGLIVSGRGADPTDVTPAGTRRFRDIAVSRTWTRPLPDLRPAGLAPIVAQVRLTADAPGDPLAFSLAPGAPAGAAVDSVTGRFTWTPTIDQANASHEVTIHATRRGLRDVTQSQTFRVTLPAVNHAPTLAAIADRSISLGQTLRLVAVGSDVDPGQGLTYSLDPGAPSGFAIDPTSGAITWTPSAKVSGAVVTVRVSDGPMSAATSFRVSALAVAPSVAIPDSVAAATGQAVAFIGTFAAPGVSSWTATVDYGDGSPPAPLALLPDKTFVVAHNYLTPGFFVVRVTVRDADGLSGTARTTVAVTSIGVTSPRIDRFLAGPIASGPKRSSNLTLAFDRSVNVEDGAFVLLDKTRRVVPVRVSYATIGGRTVVTLSFSGRGPNGKLRPPGRYTLFVRPAKIRDGDGRRPDGASFTFIRDYRDRTGDGRVTRADTRLARAHAGSM